MKLVAQILLFVFITFLVTPTVISIIEKSADTSVFYSFSEEEKAHKEIKAIFDFDHPNTPLNLSQLNSSLIHSENLSRHDKITSKIFILPPDHI